MPPAASIFRGGPVFLSLLPLKAALCSNDSPVFQGDASVLQKVFGRQKGGAQCLDYPGEDIFWLILPLDDSLQQGEEVH